MKNITLKHRLIAVFLFVSFFAVGDELKITISGDNTSNIKLDKSENNKLYLGGFEKQQRVKILLFNKLSKDVLIDDWRSPCPCLEIVKMPEKIINGKSSELVINVKPAGYSGRIVKYMPVTLLFENKTKIIFLPIEFFAGKEQIIKEPKPPKAKTWILYNGGKLDDRRYGDAAAWLFGGRDCAQCNYLKRYVLPKLFTPTTKLVRVNIDQRQGFMLLFNLEKKLKVEKPGQPPILFWKNKLYYGNEKIKELLKKSDI